MEITNTDDVIDKEAIDELNEMSGGDQEILEDVINTYVQDAAMLVEEIRQAAEAGDADTLQRKAHPLKSSSASLGARKFAELCKALEAAGRAGALEGIQEKTKELTVEFKKVRNALQTFLSV
ncbi:MAG: Hpt domain-containing protein [Gammaproteobacteria bacterium]|nr:Hpt domain-containing protein [Gammaproteobacteria bacterium]